MSLSALNLSLTRTENTGMIAGLGKVVVEDLFAGDCNSSTYLSGCQCSHSTNYVPGGAICDLLPSCSAFNFTFVFHKTVQFLLV